MRTSGKQGLILLSIASLTLALVAACGDDDESPSPSPSPTPTTPVSPAPTASPTPSPSPTQMTIKIGVISDLTGPASQAMTVVDAALADLVRYFNEEGMVPGAKLEVVTYDGEYNPSKDIPGYQWLKDRGADVIFTGLPSVPISLMSLVQEDEMVLFSCTAQKEFVEPPGWIFALNITNPEFMYTMLNWIAENDWDYEANGPAKIGAVGMVGPYQEFLQMGMEDYAEAHPDQFEWVAGHMVDWTTTTWAPEVESLAECDYILPPSTGFSVSGYIGEYQDAGYTATFIGTDAHPSYLGLMAQDIGWEGFDGMLFSLPNRWWSEDAEVPNLANQLLEDYHSESEAEQIKWAGISYIGSFGMWYAALNVLAEAINEAGPANFDSQALYDTAQNFSMTFGGCEEWNYTETKRTNWNYLGIYEADASVQDLVRKDPAWQPVRYEP